MRKLITFFGVAAAVAAFAAPLASGSDYRGRYQLKLDEAKTLLTAPAPSTR